MASGPTTDLILPPIKSGQLMSSPVDVDDQGRRHTYAINSRLPLDHVSAAHEENTESYLHPQQLTPQAAHEPIQAPTTHIANITTPSPEDTKVLDSDATGCDGKQGAADSTFLETDITMVDAAPAFLPTTPLPSPDHPSRAVVYDADWVRTTFRLNPKTIHYPLSPQSEMRNLAPLSDEIRGDEPWLHEIFALTPSPSPSPEPEVTLAHFTLLSDEPVVDEYLPASSPALESVVESASSTLISSELPLAGGSEPDVGKPSCAPISISLACQLISPLEDIVDEKDQKRVETFEKILVDVFKYPRPSYRPLQLASMLCAVQGKDVVVFLPTGAGKSLCFQVPALCPYSDSKPFPPLTVVVCPTIALIRDQLSKLWSRRIRAVCVTGEQNEKERSMAYSQLKTARLLYIAPEGLRKIRGVQEALSERYDKGCLERFVIDEAHCIEECGRTYREDYRLLGSHIRDYWSDVPITLLSATLTSQSLQAALTAFRLKRAYLLKGSLNRPNLYWEVRHKGTEYLQDMASVIASNIAEGRACGLVYERTQNGCEGLATRLRQYGISAYAYHADLGKKEKQSVQYHWEIGQINVVVATTAFGQGIDKADVRFVIHATMPETMESLYQETGRAGRDGNNSICILYFSHEQFVTMSGWGNGAGKSCSPRQLSDLKKVKDFAGDKITCRRVLLLKHFGEEFDPANCAGSCDNCKAAMAHRDDPTDATRHAIELLTLLDEVSKSTKPQVTNKQIIVAYIGKPKNYLIPEYRDLASTGVGAELSSAYIEALLEELLRQGGLKYYKVQRGHGSTWYLQMGPEATHIMNGSRHVFVDHSIPVEREDSERGSRKRKAEEPSAGPSSSKRSRVKRRQAVEDSEQDGDYQDVAYLVDRDNRSRASGKRTIEEPAAGERRSQRLRAKAAQVVEDSEEDSDDQSNFSELDRDDRSREKGKRKAEGPAAGERRSQRLRVQPAQEVVDSEEDGEDDEIEFIGRRTPSGRWREELH